MTKWLKLYATYTFSTSHNLCHRTTLLNTNVQIVQWNLLQLDCKSVIHRSSVHHILQQELQLKCLKKTNVQELTRANKQARMTRARQLLNQYPNHTDEKLFTVAAPTNSQNDRFYVRPGTRKKNFFDSFERDWHSASQSVDVRPMDAGLAF